MKEGTNSKVGSVRPAKLETVEVKLDAEVIQKAAEIATTIIMQKYGQAIGVTRDDILSANVVSLTAALVRAVDADAKLPAGVLIPVYFDSMIRGLRTKVGRTVLTAQLSSVEVVLPTNYRNTVTMMKAVGIGFGKPHAPALEDSCTLALGKENIDSVACITGNLESVAMEDIIRRAFLEIEAKGADMIARLTGELMLTYGELDCLVEDYYISQVKVSLT